MKLSTTFNPVTAYDGGMAGRKAGAGFGNAYAMEGVRDMEGARDQAPDTGERIVYSSPWLLTQNTQSRKEYLEALERPDNTWDVIKHELYYAHGRWREDGVDVMATGLSAEELAEFLQDYEDEQQTKARDTASSQSFDPDLDALIYKKLKTPDTEADRKKDKDTEPESMMEPVIKPPRLETVHPALKARPGLA